ncbi:MAG: hypothetical protein ACOC0N_12700 [Chroococcales cyanobacterium]
MNTNQKILSSLFTGLLFLSLTGCNLENTSNNSLPTEIESQPSQTTQDDNNTPQANNSPTETQPLTAANSNTATVTVYHADKQCQNLVPEEVAVSSSESMEAAVGKVLEMNDTADFEIAGYRVNVNQGTATIDMRLSPDSQREFGSLSSCEKFALFGSLRRTLTENPQWQVQNVNFTQQGEEILL